MKDLEFQTPDYSSVTPLSTVYVCHGVPLNTSYKDTLTFSNQAEQFSYFASKAKHVYDRLSPIGIGTAIRLPVEADILFDCNYCIITNSNFSQRNLYCFITEIKYVNLNSCEIKFQIDVMQTWYFDMNVQACLVEREHVNNDAIGSNTLGENLPLGEYKRQSRIRANVTANRAVMVTLPGDPNSKDYSKLTGGIFSGLRQVTVPVENGAAGAVKDLLQSYINDGEEDKVLAIQMIPSDFITERGTTAPKTKDIKIAKSVDTIDGYSPKNNKLKQYPYVYLEIDNTQGQTGIFKYEYFSTSDCNFRIVGVTSGDAPELILFPLNYDGMGTNVMEHMTLGGFPMCAWSGDAYKAYLANNSMKQAITIGSELATTGLSTGINAATGNMPAAAASLASGGIGVMGTVGGYMQEDNNARIQGNKMRGTRGSNAFYSSKLMDFWLTRKSIDASHARAIDDYFTRYGYRVDRIKVPNRTGRKSFNYVKTMGAAVTGKIPFDDLKLINQIFDSGITFWHGDYVGNYARDNGIA